MKKNILGLALFCGFLAKGQHHQIDSSEISVAVKHATIAGSLYVPAGVRKPPVVLIIGGSGPTDRNGNSIALPGKNNSLLQIAETLGQNGIASLRYDKRFVGKTRMTPGIPEDSTVFGDMVNDAEQLYHYLEKHGYKKIYIAGHSEGSLIGMVLAQRVKAAGYISIAGVGRKAGDLLKEQLLSTPEKLRLETYAALDSLEAGHLVKKVNPMLFSILRPSVQPYMISWLSYDPPKIISTLSCRILIIQGTHDLQVQTKDANALKEANPKAKLVIIENMNHVLKEVKTDDKEENTKAYSDPRLVVMKELTDEIVNFINRKN